jgi:acetyltransferase-like isoleucine patch superfamily enzyme
MPDDKLVAVRATLSSLRTYVLNHVVNRIPFVALRQRAYAALGVRLEDHSTGMIMLHTEVNDPEDLSIGSHCIIGRACVLDARGGIKIGRSVNIGSGASLQTGKHLVDSPDFAYEFLPIVVGDRAWIAEGARILAGVTIGEGAVVAAGSVVTKDVEPYTVVGGVPARHIRDRPRDLRYTLNYRANFR